jgi:hypothetical protein
MESNSNSKSGLLTAGGVLSIIAGILEVIGGVLITILTIVGRIIFELTIFPSPPGGWEHHIMPIIPFWLLLVGAPIIALGIVAIVGGISAIRRGSFGLSLAGAICALLSSILGILAVIFVSLSRREFQG